MFPATFATLKAAAGVTAIFGQSDYAAVIQAMRAELAKARSV